jgi:SRSO17 transposase
MQSTEELATAVDGWVKELGDLHARIARHFVRAEPRQHVLTYLKGLLGPLERKNGWQIAEWGGDQTPDCIQRLLSKAKWDAGLVRDDLQRYVMDHLAESQAILIVDETGFPKQGDKSAGVQVQYCGTTGHVENCQVGVFIASTSTKGATFLDRELYLPQSWTQDRQRCRAAGIADSIGYVPKTKLARHMVERVTALGIPFAWVVADALYGDDADLRTWLEEQHLPYILAVHSDEPVVLLTEQGMRIMAVKECVQLVDATQGFQRVSMGEGTKGARMFDWACLRVLHHGVNDQQHWVLIRRSVVDPTKCAFYLVYGPVGTTLQEMVRAAGARWKIEEVFEAAKEEVGFDQYEVRLWTSWYRHITLAMLAHAYLTVMRAQTGGSDPARLLEIALELLPLTLAEVRHLLWQTAWPHAPPLRFILAWSLWRRRHQAAAKCSHTKRRCSKPMTSASCHLVARQDQQRRKSRKGLHQGQWGPRLISANLRKKE